MVQQRNGDGTVGQAERDRGQAAILLLLVATALIAAVMSGLATFGMTLRDRARAQSAADAAALASLDGGQAAARAIAGANGATLESWTAGPGVGEVTVVVRVGSETGTARASDAVSPPEDGGESPLTGP